MRLHGNRSPLTLQAGPFIQVQGIDYSMVGGQQQGREGVPNLIPLSR
jgi:hypothetical protein